MEVSDESMSLTYGGTELGEEGEIMAEVIYILEENGQQGVEEILKALKERGIRVGINKLRALLKKQSGKELLEERGPKGKRLYSLNPAS
jgi:repressor of nif and glnA expression